MWPVKNCSYNFKMFCSRTDGREDDIHLENDN